MTYTLIDYFKAFHTLKETRKLSAGSQAVYFSILGEFNAARFPERLQISIRELKALAGLKSTNAVFESRNVLKNNNLIDFRNEFGTSIYSLSTEHLLNSNRTLTEHLLNSSGTPVENSNIRVREDVKTKDSQSVGRSARACASAFDWNDETEEQLTALWLGNNGARVSIELLSYLRSLVEKHGVDWTEAIIREAANAYDGQFSMNVNFLRGCVSKLEGGDRRVRVGGQSRNNRPNVLAFAGGRTGGNFGGTATGKGRFDDNPDYA